MFENIIGQQEVVRTISGELQAGRFPRSTLFFGPPYTGKLSTALEAARVLTCAEGRAEWSCECASCRMQKELTHPHTMILGPRYCDVEVAACSEALLRSRKPSTRYLYLRAVRKLTRRFDPAILDAEDARTKGASEKVSLIEELLTELDPARELPAERRLGELLEQLTAALMPLVAQLRGEGITIGQVRRLAAWAHLTAGGSRKVAIIENADRMQESARNALLKLLEDPPEMVHLLLLSTRRAAIIPTILSRMRPYPFEQRTDAEEQEVLAKIFRQSGPGFENLRGFFLAWKEINPEKLSLLSGRYMDLVRGGEAGAVDIVAELAELFPDRKGQRDRSSKEAMVSFLEELTFGFRRELRAGSSPVDVLEAWDGSVREALVRLDIYNMSPQTVLESLFFRMREAAG